MIGVAVIFDKAQHPYLKYIRANIIGAKYANLAIFCCCWSLTKYCTQYNVKYSYPKKMLIKLGKRHRSRALLLILHFSWTNTHSITAKTAIVSSKYFSIERKAIVILLNGSTDAESIDLSSIRVTKSREEQILLLKKNIQISLLTLMMLSVGCLKLNDTVTKSMYGRCDRIILIKPILFFSEVLRQFIVHLNNRD